MGRTITGAWSGPVKGRAKRLRVYERAGYACQGCGLKFDVPEDPRYVPVRNDYRDNRGRSKICLLEIDHITPRWLGGTHDESNLQALCTQCNRRKGAKV